MPGRVVDSTQIYHIIDENLSPFSNAHAQNIRHIWPSMHHLDAIHLFLDFKSLLGSFMHHILGYKYSMQCSDINRNIKRLVY